MGNIMLMVFQVNVNYLHSITFFTYVFYSFFSLQLNDNEINKAMGIVITSY